MNRSYLIVLFVLFFELLAFSNRPCQARVYIDINAPYMRKIPTAVPIFKDMSEGQPHGQLLQMLSDLLEESIKFTGFFKMLDRESFLENPQEAGLVQQEINFKNWTDVGAELLIKGGVK